MILLQNNGSILPLPKGKSVAVIGPHATAQSALVGSYLGQLCPDDTFDCIISPFQAISGANAGGTTQYATGCDVTKNDTSGFPAAVALAQASDYVVLMMGIDESVEGEAPLTERDRADAHANLPSTPLVLAQARATTAPPSICRTCSTSWPLPLWRQASPSSWYC